MGGHTLNHRYLTSMNDKDLNDEIVQGKLKIELVILSTDFVIRAGV